MNSSSVLETTGFEVQTRDICNSPRRASPMSPGFYNHPKRHWRRHFCKIFGCKIISPQAPLPRLRTKYLFFLPLKIKLHSPLKTSVKHWFTPGEYGFYPWRISWKLKLHPQRILYIFFLLYPKEMLNFYNLPSTGGGEAGKGIVAHWLLTELHVTWQVWSPLPIIVLQMFLLFHICQE